MAIGSVRELWEPIFLDVDQLGDAIQELLGVEDWEVKVVASGEELFDVIVYPEALCLSIFPILDNVHSLVARQTVVERGGRDRYWHWPVWLDLGVSPSCLF